LIETRWEMRRNVLNTTLSLLAVLFTIQALCISAPSQQKASQVMELMQEGSAHYLRGDFKKAIGPYQKALDLEKQKRTLEHNLWRVLVDNLGMSYGISGNLKVAKDTFEYGISEDPEYPMFYYNVACTYGEMDNMEKAIDYLRLAFARKDNMIPGEKFPDPARDSSFARFADNEKFKAALKEMKEK
jgi:tetratricopeptide (TPR) repeat protein